jgi:hypothetical protein
VDSAPVLIVAYNRPEKTSNLINSLRESAPQRVILSVDGPREKSLGDGDKVRQVIQAAEGIDWTTDVQVISRESNLGMRFAVPDAISKVVHAHGSVIVVEDDLVLGNDFIPFCNAALNEFKDDRRVHHISGYSAVPAGHLSTNTTRARLSRFPQSFGWATWSNSWSKYDDAMSWSQNASLSDFKRITPGLIAALHWQLIFNNVAEERISSWAYRWIQSIWENDGFSIAPRVNLVTNDGYDQGSHNLTKAPWNELPIGDYDLNNLDPVQLDEIADLWLSRVQNRNNLIGLSREALVALVRSIFRERH